MSKELEEQGCTCDAGYYCRYCRVLDHEAEVRKYESENK